MKIFKNLLLVSSVFLVLESCRTVRQVSQTRETVSESSTIKKTSYKDTVFYTEKATASLKIPIKSFDFPGSGLNGVSTPLKSNLKPTVYEQKNGNATVRIVHDSLYFYAYAECDSLALKAKIREQFESERKADSLREEKEQSERQKANLWMWLSLIAVAFIAGVVISKI
ncbi:hypothetical protein LJF28_04850 [Chryseobacterium indologenes]|uniref:hypothetical protein n=1 Tax=Chryseobacterium indologenes TaxID=253 RepID=UPI001D0CEB13|nr:hypothetical protein [Chryseobacterium indologenes]UDQ54998.1 hypothetical protein LJF28_04850 [Chryseobacterium indologenes]